MNFKPKLGLGTVQFGTPYGISNRSGQTPPEEVSRILDFAVRSKIKVLDTASAYGNAEDVLGRYDLKGFRIVSKFMPPGQGEPLENQLMESLEHLKSDSLAGYLAHRPMALLKEPAQWEELLEIREKGLAEKIGYSLNEPAELEKLMNAGFKPDLIQVPFNYLDRRFADYFRELKEMGCEIHTRSAFLQGLFFIKPEELNGFFADAKPILQTLQKEIDTLPGSLLRFVLEQPEIDKVIIGVENTRQLRENLNALDRVPAGNVLPELKIKVPDRILMPSKWA
ncbi:MAG: aldo/keto reductase [Balneolaceae bacterium]